MSLSSVSAKDAIFYATGSGKDGSGIYRGSLDTKTGALTLTGLAGAVENPFWVTPTRDGKFIYAALMSKGGGEVAAFRVQEDGGLSLINRQPANGTAPCHLTLDPAGRHTLVAAYSGGSVSLRRILPDGSVGEETARREYTLAKPDEKGQSKSFAHGIYPDASGKFVYVCDLGSDAVWIYRFDEKTGALTPNDPPFAKTPAGSGPRHLAIHPNQKFVYVNGEMGMDVTVYARDEKTGGLTALQTISTLPEGTDRDGVSTSEIEIHPSQKFLYVANRKYDSFTAFSIGADGRLAWIENVPAKVDYPFSFAIDPSGKWLLAAGQRDGQVASFAIDAATGKLTPTGSTVTVAGVFHVVFAPTKE